MAQVTWSYLSTDLPGFMAEPHDAHKTMLPGGARLDVSAFPYVDAVRVTVGAAGAAVDATSVPVAIAKLNSTSTKADPVIPAGATLDFGGDKFATLTAAANLAAPSLTVRALVTALVQNDVATYQGMDMRKPIPAGTLIGRTLAERDAGTGFGQPDIATPDGELFLTAFPVQDAMINADVVLLRHGTLIYEDRLPGWATSSANFKAKVRSLYECITAPA